MEQVDIVKLIEDNPITNLSKDYNIRFLCKIIFLVFAIIRNTLIKISIP